MQQVHGSTTLVFANAKSRIELVADEFHQIRRRETLRCDVLVHHGSLSPELRLEAEERLQRGGACIAVCSNTLELGIDVGAIDNIVQISAPWSVSSLRQRTGRSGRRAESPATLFVHLVEERTPHDDPWKRLRLQFVRTVATIDLMLTNWVEPHGARHHRSTQVHQMLSMLAETGGLAPSELFDRVTLSRVFGQLSVTQFAKWLRFLGAKDIVAQLGDGSLVLGLAGEAMVEHRRFYAVFAASDELQVVYRSERIGTIPIDWRPGIGEPFMLGGRRWEVVNIDIESLVVVCRPSQKMVAREFISASDEVHPTVHERMRQVISSDDAPVYLRGAAPAILGAARNEARRSGTNERSLRPLATGSTGLMLWAGTRVARTIWLALLAMKISTRDHGIGVEIQASAADARRALEAMRDKMPTMESLAGFAFEKTPARLWWREKYDQLIPEELWLSAFANDRLDGLGAWAALDAALAAPTFAVNA